MSSENNDQIFEYTYSASLQEEVKKIREKYVSTPKQESKLETLRRLDASATRKGTVISLILGIVGTLTFGTGMCCCLVWSHFILGVFIGILGIVLLALAYPAYTYFSEKERKRIAPQILLLSEELLQ